MRSTSHQMTQEIKRILEINDMNQLQTQNSKQKIKLKTGLYKKIPSYPFQREHPKFTEFKPPFGNGAICSAFPPYSNLQSSELYRQICAIYNIIGPINCIKVSEHAYYRHFGDNGYFTAYFAFTHIIDTVFRFQLHFMKAADYLQMNIYNVMIQFYNYCSIVQQETRSWKPAKGQHDFMRCYQVISYYMQVTGTLEKLENLLEKHFEDCEQANRDIFQMVQAAPSSATKGCQGDSVQGTTTYKKLLALQQYSISSHTNMNHQHGHVVRVEPSKLYPYGYQLAEDEESYGAPMADKVPECVIESIGPAPRDYEIDIPDDILPGVQNAVLLQSGPRAEQPHAMQ